MQKEIQTISLLLPFRMGRVNCYLIQTGDGYILIDTGGSNNRKDLVRELESAGCKPGLLKFIVLTHGDFDHTGNAAFLRSVFGGKIAMHRDDSGMVERGDMFENRKKPNLVIRSLLPIFSRFVSSERFTPDLLVEDGDELSEYGLEAKVLSIPGHSKGSIGILTTGADLFGRPAGKHKPVLNSPDRRLSSSQCQCRELRSMSIDTVYPGHGRPFRACSVEVGSQLLATKLCVRWRKNLVPARALSIIR
jgi:glyoxylase-like metal-dependent hydrolase (beta-lactamase superfamily II)